MKPANKILALAVVAAMCLFIGIGYAALSDNMSVTGSADVVPELPDVYITNVTPDSSGGEWLTTQTER